MTPREIGIKRIRGTEVDVANNGCNGNDLRLGFYAVEWNRFNGDEDR